MNKGQISYDHVNIIAAYKSELLRDDTTFNKNDKGQGYTLGKPTTIAAEVKNSAISQRKGRLLYFISNYLKPLTVLELGTNTGISTLYLALGVNDNKAKISTVEGDKVLAEVAARKLNALIQAGTISTDVMVKQELFVSALPELLDEHQPLDMLFIDGDHNGNRVMEYFISALSYLSEKGIVILDDISWSPDMWNTWQTVSIHDNVTMALDFGDIGVLFVDKNLSREYLRLRY